MNEREKKTTSTSLLLQMGRESVAVVSSPPTATARGTATVAATSLAPGFRFHPTDEELVSYYLKRKVMGKPVRFDAIGDVDIYKHEPWDLAGASLGFSNLSLSLPCLGKEFSFMGFFFSASSWFCLLIQFWEKSLALWALSCRSTFCYI